MNRALLISLLLAAILLPGCSGNDDSKADTIQPNDEQYTQQKQSTELTDLQQLEADKVPVDAALLHAETILGIADDLWLVYQENVKGNVTVFHHGEKSKTNIPYEIASSLPIQAPWEQQLSEMNVFTSFHSELSKFPDWILLTSDPAMGLMNKRLYGSPDNGYTWSLIKDVSTVIDGYVTGVSFRDGLNGWITASQHGEQLVPLYRTRDGGKSWTAQPIPIPDGYNYGNVNPPAFHDNDTMKGTLSIEFVNEDDQKTFNYVTSEGGETWKQQSSQ